MLRDHPIFLTPIAVNRAGLVDKPWPADWNDPHEGTTIKVLPLSLQVYFPGWYKHAASAGLYATKVI